MLSNMSYCKPGCGTWHRFSPSQNSFVDSQVDCLKAALREAVNHYIMASAHVCHTHLMFISQTPTFHIGIIQLKNDHPSFYPVDHDRCSDSLVNRHQDLTLYH